jgi:hypothetical protein
LAGVEYGENELQFSRLHNKMVNIWAHLHPLEGGEETCNLGDYTLIHSKEEVVLVLKEGLGEAQKLMRTLNMAPSNTARQKQWFKVPWKVEAADVKSFIYTHTVTPEDGDDGDFEVLWVTIEQTLVSEESRELAAMDYTTNGEDAGNDVDEARNVI